MTAARRPNARLAVAYLALLTLAALGADWIAPYDFREQLSGMGAQAPSAAHWLGTDPSMRDVWSRMLYGTRNTLGIALLAGGLFAALSRGAGRGLPQLTTACADRRATGCPCAGPCGCARSCAYADR